MMTYCQVSKERVKKHAEVFSPAGLVFEMIMYADMRECLQIDKTILDPAVGEGQFPCAELVMKMFYNLERLDEETALRALASLYGIDIQPSSVEKARTHLLLTLQDAYRFFTGKEFTRLDEAQEIVGRNMIIGDSFKLLKEWANPQGVLF